MFLADGEAFTVVSLYCDVVSGQTTDLSWSSYDKELRLGVIKLQVILYHPISNLLYARH